MVELAIEAVVAGGAGLAHDRDGRVVFVEGALPGEAVLAHMVDRRADYARARIGRVLSASPDRMEPACPTVAAGCGGCPWAHVKAERQGRLKADIVVDALRRLAHVPDPPLASSVRAVSPAGYRTTVRVAVDAAGRPAFHRRTSDALVAPERCLVAHPRLETLLTESRFPGARSVVLRVSAATGDAVAMVTGGDRCSVPADVRVVTRRTASAQHALVETVAGRQWRISPDSFFQSGPEAAELLVRTVDEVTGGLPAGARLIDAYAGVGLLGGVVASRTGARLTAVERQPAAAGDARVNLAGQGGRVMRAEVASSGLPAADVVIADPARPGLGRQAAARLADTGASSLILVHCDPASLARDVGLLARRGFGLVSVHVLDLFPGTFHVETVTRLERH